MLISMYSFMIPSVAEYRPFGERKHDLFSLYFTYHLFSKCSWGSPLVSNLKIHIFNQLPKIQI